MTRNIYRLLAVAVLSVHLVWIVWVTAGWLVTRQRPLWRSLHILSLIYSILIETLPWPCPLTILEQWLEGRAGIKPYREPFLIHYLEAVVYPDIPPRGLTVCAVAICLFILAWYAFRFRSRQGAEW